MPVSILTRLPLPAPLLVTLPLTVRVWLAATSMVRKPLPEIGPGAMVRLALRVTLAVSFNVPPLMMTVEGVALKPQGWYRC